MLVQLIDVDVGAADEIVAAVVVLDVRRHAQHFGENLSRTDQIMLAHYFLY